MDAMYDIIRPHVLLSHAVTLDITSLLKRYHTIQYHYYTTPSVARGPVVPCYQYAFSLGYQRVASSLRARAAGRHLGAAVAAALAHPLVDEEPRRRRRAARLPRPSLLRPPLLRRARLVVDDHLRI
jgi:hypothetical protein